MKEDEDDSCQMSLYSDSQDIAPEQPKSRPLPKIEKKKKNKFCCSTKSSLKKKIENVDRKENRESLLDIFKQAIEQETLNIQQ